MQPTALGAGRRKEECEPYRAQERKNEPVAFGCRPNPAANVLAGSIASHASLFQRLQFHCLAATVRSVRWRRDRKAFHFLSNP